MTERVTNIAVLGSTGSIGQSTLEVIGSSNGSMRAIALSANSRTDLLLEQAKAVCPRCVVVSDRQAAEQQDWSSLPQETELLVGAGAIPQVVTENDVDIVVSAIVGTAGLRGTWAALEAGKRVALANKESLVAGGPLVTRLAKAKHAQLLPVDSEHSAIFQALQAGNRDEVHRIVLTSSGGPFRTVRARWRRLA